MWDETRSDWLGGRPFTGPAFNPSTCERIVVHYIGTARAPRTFRSWMLNTHLATMAKKPPYAFMYNAAVDLDGNLWEGRGLDFRNAANKDTNATTWSIVIATDGQAEANNAQVDAVERAVKGVRDFTRKRLAIIGHRDVASTSCPGDGVYRQVLAGTFEPRPPIPPIPTGDILDMIVLDFQPNTPNWTAILWAGNSLSWLSNGNADLVLRNAKVSRQTVSETELAGIIEASHTVTAPPSTLSDSLRQAWILRRR